MQTLPRSFASWKLRSNLKITTPFSLPGRPGIGSFVTAIDLGLALVVRDRETRVVLDAGEPLLGLVEVCQAVSIGTLKAL